MASSIAGRMRVPGAWRVPRPARRAVVGFAVTILVWQLLATASGVEGFFFPRPTDAAAEFVDLVRKGILPAYLFDSLWRWFVGTVVGVVLGVAVLVVMVLSSTVRVALMPVVSFFHSIAGIAWIPLLILWFGFSFLTITITIAYVVFFPVLYNALVGVRAVPPAAVNAVRSLGANRLQVIGHVLLPGAMPNILTGVRIGSSFAFRALIAAEIIAGSSGIGYMIFEGRGTQNTPRVIVGMIVMGVIWLVIDYTVVRPMERITVERWGLVERAGDG